MACALPVVASENDYLAEYVTPGADALTVPPEDPAALRDALERVLGDRVLAEGLGTAARLRVERGHTTLSFAGGLAASLRSFLDRPFAPGETG
jgi:glycosyltransferase involved in cell wall biosynthesis